MSSVKLAMLWLQYPQEVHVRFIIVMWQQLVLCLVSMGTLLLGKVKPLTNKPTLPSTFCSAAGLEGDSQQSHTQINVY